MMIRQKGIRVLIAEDEFLPAAQIRDKLETAGYEVVGDAIDGPEAVDMTASLLPDVVLMDINMPGIDGIEATRLIQEKNPTPVVILTAYQTPELVSRARDAGVGAYIVKPPDIMELDRTIEIARHRFSDMMSLRDLNTRLRKEIEVRRETEGRLKKAVEDKARLMRELLHRTKNNMYSIANLLCIHSTLIRDENVLHVFKKIENCVNSMMRVQEMLYKTGEFENIDLQSYLNNIANMIFRGYHTMVARIGLRIDLESVTVSADTAILCGMIVNELISNSVKYAFPGDRHGEIRLNMRVCGNGMVELIVCDNGMGLPEGFATRDGLGMKLVKGFANQIDGSVEFRNSNPGTAVVVSFKYDDVSFQQDHTA